MDGADAGAREHGDDRLGDHRHVDQHPVARLDPEIVEYGAERRRLVHEFAIGDRAPGRGEGAVVIKRDRIAPAGLDMAVERVEAGVQARVGEPAAVDAGFSVENALRRFCPRDLARGFRPEGLRVGAPAIIGLPVAVHRFAPNRRLRSRRRSRRGELSRAGRPMATLARSIRSFKGRFMGQTAYPSRKPIRTERR